MGEGTAVARSRGSEWLVQAKTSLVTFLCRSSKGLANAAALALIAGAVCLGMGLTALLAWHYQWPHILRLRPDFPPIQYNTGIGFVFAGAGLIAARARRRRIVVAAGVLLALLGLLTCGEYLFGVQFGIDQLAPGLTLQDGRPYSGRLTPNVAAAFSLAGAVLILFGCRPGRRGWAAAAALLSTPILILDVVALAGYLTSLPGAYIWASSAGMSPQASAGFVVMATGLLAWAWEQAGGDAARQSWLPGLMGCTLAMVMFLLYEGFLHQRRLPAEAMNNTPWSEMVLALGLVMAALVAVAGRLAQVARAHANRLMSVIGELNHEIAHREVVEEQLRHRIALNHREIAARKRAVEELRQSERRYRDLFERNLAGVYRADVDGRLLDCNQAFARIFGFASREEALQHNTLELYEDRAERTSLIDKLLRDGSLVNQEVRLRRLDGTRVWILSNASLVADDSERRTIIEGTAMDITERHGLQEQLLHAQKMEAVGQLAGGIAHDFNNMLMVISGYADLLLDGGKCDPTLQQSAGEILKAARRAGTLTRQLLAFSRKQTMRPTIQDLNDVLAEMGKMLPRLVREDIEVQLVPGVELWKVKADPVQVEQIVINVVVNARDAMPGAGQITVETRNVHAGPEYVRSHPTLPEGDYVVLSVRDTGVGIAPGVQARMFEPFFTTKAKGTGLGLATVYGVVKQSGGSIWVESEAGKGTLFEIYLPRTEAETQGAQAPKADTADERGCETVLLVEDEEAVRVSTSQYLLRRGYTVLQGNSGADALNKMARHPGKIDVLITDVIMPGMSGPALADDLLRRLPELRVLYISGYVDKTLEQYGITSEVFLQKPFSLAALGRKLRQVLDGGARAQEPNKELASAR